MTYFHLDADLPRMMHLYMTFDDPIMYGCWDMNSDVNLNVDADEDGDALEYANSPPQLRWCQLKTIADDNNDGQRTKSGGKMLLGRFQDWLKGAKILAPV